MKEAEHRILHLSYDIGDFNKTDKTTAVSNLIKATELFSEPTVVSLNRVNSPSKESTKNIKKGLISINSFGLPLGILHKSNLNRAYNRILKASEKDLLNLKNVDLIHSHKLTFEGYLGYRLSLRLKCPLLVTLRQTDFDVLKYRPDLRGLYKKIILHSSGIFYLVPIMKRLLADRFGSNFYNENIEGKLSYIPNIVPTGGFTQRNNIAADAPLVTILRMNKRSVKRKNIKNLIKAASTLDRQFEIHIIGSGDYLKVVKNWISQYKAESKIKLIGEVNHSLIDEYYSKAKGFILPSFSESFGLVYAESLLNGTPILYSKGVIGFDGVFENVGPAVDPYSVNSIREGLIDILDNFRSYRSNIRQLNDNNEFRIFSPEYAAAVYKSTLRNIIPLNFVQPKQGAGQKN